ncbi:hypothetical protein LCGC14_0384560 [marine sediment metagenome]|uniref:Uncharacterized protein n=1 Tax=marine sediment metagenome TaxID=412755 RepID=A0A0F9TJJ9_9ZZZZ
MFGWIKAVTLLSILIVAAVTLGALWGPNLTQDRLVYGDSAYEIQSVSDLTAWIGGTAGEIAVADDGDGTITISMPAPVYGELSQSGGSFVTADSITVNTGTVASGTVADTYTVNSTYHQVTEIAGGGGGFDVEYIFTVADNPASLSVVGRYEGTVAHSTVVEAWNYTGGTWDTFTGAGDDMDHSTTDAEFTFTYAALAGAITDYVSGTASKFRIFQAPPGTGTDNLYIDAATIQIQQYAIASPGVYGTITGMSLGENNGITMNASSGTWTIVTSGLYDARCAISFSGTPSTRFLGHFHVDGAIETESGFSRRLGSGGDVGPATIMGLLALSAAEVVTVAIAADVGGVYVAIERLNCSLTMIRGS